MEKHGYWNCKEASCGLDGDRFYCFFFDNVYSEYDDICESCKHWTDKDKPKKITNWEKYFGSPTAVRLLSVRHRRDGIVEVRSSTEHIEIKAEDYFEWLNAEADTTSDLELKHYHL